MDNRDSDKLRGRFTERFDKALALALREANIQGLRESTPTALLLGILSVERGVAVTTLQRLGFDIAAIKEEARRNLETTPPQLSGLTAIIDSAQTETLFWGHSHVGTEHLVIALILSREPTLVSHLRQRKLNLDDIRRAIIAVLGDAPGPSLDVFPKDRQWP